MRHAIGRVIHREFMLAARNVSQVINPLFFFIITIVLFPLSLPVDVGVLQTVAPGIVWMAALFAILLSIDRLFLQDVTDGIFEQWLLSPHSFSLLLLAKIICHWCINILPLIILTPLVALMLQLTMHQALILAGSLLLGTPILLLLTALAAAFTVSEGNKGVLMALIVFPLVIPVIIFGAGSLVYAGQSEVVMGLFALLGALLIITLIALPIAISSALRINLN